MSNLIVDPETRRRVASLRAFAEDPEHWYHLDVSDWVPGDLPEYVANVSGFRCVFTWTRDAKVRRVFRHLSVSVDRAQQGKFPHPAALYMLADLFGFTGLDIGASARAGFAPPGDWSIMIKRDDEIPNAVLAQEVRIEHDGRGGA